MKKIIALLVIAFSALTAFSQTNLKVLGTVVKPDANVGLIYLIDIDSIHRKDDVVKFKGIISAFEVATDTPVEGFLVESLFSANCKTYIWSELTKKGKWGEKIIDEKDSTKDRQAIKADPIYEAIKVVCSDKPPGKTSAD